MKFLLLVHHNEDSFGKLSTATQQQMLNESIALTHVLHADGQYLHASPVLPESTAKIVRVRDGKSFVTDGPFVETHEQLGGYFLVKAKDIDEAVGIAARIPGGRIGAVEVRQVRDINGLPNE